MKHAIRLFSLAVWAWCAAAFAAPTTLATLTLGADTAGVAIDPELRRAYVTNYTSGTVSVIDLDANTATTYAAGSNPRRLVVDAARHLVYWVNDTNPGGVTVFDGKTNTTVTRIPVGNRPRAIAEDFQNHLVFAVNRDSNSVSFIDTNSNAVIRTVPVGVQATSIDVNPTLGRLYVITAPNNTVSVIDENTGVVTAVPVGRNPTFARVDERTGKVYVNNVDDRTMSIIGTGNTVIKTIATGAGTTSNFAIASAVYHRVYLANALDNTLTIVDTDSDTVVRTVAVGASPQDVVLDAGDANLYVVNQAGNSVTVLDARSEAVINTIPVGTSPWRATTGLDRLLVLNVNGSAADSITISTEQETLGNTDIATEWYHAGFNHYFHTAGEVENRVLLDGRFGKDWQRTLQFFRVWNAAAPGLSPVCRFFLQGPSFGSTSSTFYTPYPGECQNVKSNADWHLESDDVYYLMLTDQNGNCPAGTAPLYRVYNNGQGGAPNHRYTADRATRDVMVAQGWSMEGNGPDVIFACTPTLRGD